MVTRNGRSGVADILLVISSLWENCLIHGQKYAANSNQYRRCELRSVVSARIWNDILKIETSEKFRCLSLRAKQTNV